MGTVGNFFAIRNCCLNAVCVLLDSIFKSTPEVECSRGLWLVVLNYRSRRGIFCPPSAHITSLITTFFFVVLLLHPGGFGNIGPDKLETENQQEPEPEQESQYTIHQLPTMNDPDNFGFDDVSPNTLEAEHQQEQEQNTSTQKNTAETPPKKKR